MWVHYYALVNSVTSYGQRNGVTPVPQGVVMTYLFSFVVGLSMIGCGERPLTEATSNHTTDHAHTGSTTVHAHTGMSAPGDWYAQQACKLNGYGTTVMTLAASKNEAATVVFLPKGGTAAALIQMPETGDGWMVLEATDWVATFRLFTDGAVEYEVMGGEKFTEREANEACPTSGMTDQSWYFQEWGSYLVRFDEKSPKSFWFLVSKEK